jgi:hypothetical protein
MTRRISSYEERSRCKLDYGEVTRSNTGYGELIPSYAPSCKFAFCLSCGLNCWENYFIAVISSPPPPLPISAAWTNGKATGPAVDLSEGEAFPVNNFLRTLEGMPKRALKGLKCEGDIWFKSLSKTFS